MNKISTQEKHVINRGEELPVIVIVGPTASGKSATALRIAEEFQGEIICADSRTIYKDMNIGTAKPSLEDQARVPHWGLDLVAPGESFTAADFKKYAMEKIAEIRSRGHIPLLVGGTGLYVDGVVFDYQFGQPDAKLREELEKMSDDDLKKYCVNNNVTLPENDKNRRYVIRAIEQKTINSKMLNEPIPHTIIVGIATEKEDLRNRIEARSEQLFENGMVEEAILLGKKYGWDSEAMTGNIYKLVRQFLNNELTEAELEEKFITADWRLAKRQLTWLKRNPFIQWMPLGEAYDFLKAFIARKTSL